MTEKILITGGAGFIGSNLAERLVSEGHTVKVLDNFSGGSVNNIRHLLNHRNFKLMTGDIRDYNVVTEAIEGVDIVYHLAAKIHVDYSVLYPRETQEVNVMGTLNLLEASRANDVGKFVYASSSEVYGSAVYSPMDEKHPLNPASPYAASKAAADRLCYSYINTYGMDITIVRNFNTFGPRQKDNGYGGVISIFARRALAGLPPIIYGDGKQTRDYMYIKDAVKAYCLIKDNRKKVAGETLNFGTGKDYSISDIAKKVIFLCGKEGVLFPAHVESRPGEVRKLCVDTSKAKKLLGFEPEYDFDRGLKEYVDWLKVYRDIG